MAVTANLHTRTLPGTAIIPNLSFLDASESPLRLDLQAFRLQSLKTLPDTLPGISWVQPMKTEPSDAAFGFSSINLDYVIFRSRSHLASISIAFIAPPPGIDRAPYSRMGKVPPCNLLPRSSNSRKLPKVCVSRYVVAMRLGSNFRPLCDSISLAQTRWGRGR